MHGHGYVYQHKLYYYMVHLRNLFAITLLMIYLSATIDSEDDYDNYYNDTDEDDEDEPLSDSFSDYETDNNPNWRVERLQREEYLTVYMFVHIEATVYLLLVLTLWSVRHVYIKITIIYVTGPEKTGLIYTKYTYLYYGAYLFFCVCYPISVSCIAFLRILCICDEICLTIL